jgi:hypothetical protein
MDVPYFYCIKTYIPLDIFPAVVVLDCVVVLFSVFLRIFILFFIVIVLVYILMNSIKWYCFATFLQTFVDVCGPDDSHSNSSEEKFYYG